MKKSQPNFEKMQTVSSNNVEQQSKSYNYKKERGKNLKKKKMLHCNCTLVET